MQTQEKPFSLTATTDAMLKAHKLIRSHLSPQEVRDIEAYEFCQRLISPMNTIFHDVKRFEQNIGVVMGRIVFSVYAKRSFIKIVNVDSGEYLEYVADQVSNRGYSVNAIHSNNYAFLHQCSDVIADYVTNHLASK